MSSPKPSTVSQAASATGIVKIKKIRVMSPSFRSHGERCRPAFVPAHVVENSGDHPAMSDISFARPHAGPRAAPAAFLRPEGLADSDQGRACEGDYHSA